MWFPFWRSRNRFSVEELRYLTDQLHNVHIVNDVNKDFVIEALRSISELITYGDQNDPAFFDFFMEREVMGELVRILKISKPLSISLQLLQTMGIIIQNLKNERAICYMFSNINNLITYSFNFDNEELLSYFISFLRATSGKLNKTTISLLVNTENEEVVSLPLYVEAIQFAFHEENMIRTAIRAITLNVYHVGDESVNRFVAKQPQAKYFSSMIKFFRRQCVDLNGLVSNAMRSSDPDALSDIVVAVDEIEDTLYYFSDITSAGIPDVGMLITKKMWKHLVFPLLLPSLRAESTSDIQLGSITSMYLLCCILHIVKIKDLANVIAAGLFCPPEVFVGRGGSKVNGFLSGHDLTQESQQLQPQPDSVPEDNNGPLRVIIPVNSRDSQIHQEEDNTSEKFFGAPHIAMRDTLLSFVRNGDDAHVLASLSMLAMLLQTKGCTVRSIQLTDRVLISSSISLFVELDESMLDALGILPQRKQHKKLLLEALVGEASAEEQLFSSGVSLHRDSISSELDDYLQRLKSHYGLSSLTLEEGASPRIHRFQVLDSLVALFGRSNISAETLWYGGWLLRQLLPYGEAEFSSHHLVALKDSYGNCFHLLLEESRGIWPDLLLMVICDEWKKCKRAIEAPSPRKEPKSILTSLCKPSEDSIPSESSFAAGARMCEMVKVFVLVHQLLLFSYGKTLPDQPAIDPSIDVPENSRAKTAGLDAPGPKPGTELELVDALPCRISFERGKERHFHFLAASLGTSGWIVLAEESPLKQRRGVVRVSAPLASSNPLIDEKHPKWLHLKIRPSTLPSLDPTKGKARRKPLVDGRWTLAFRDESSCKAALNMVVDEKHLQSKQVERRLQPLMNDVIGSSTLSKSNLSSTTRA